MNALDIRALRKSLDIMRNAQVQIVAELRAEANTVTRDHTVSAAWLKMACDNRDDATLALEAITRLSDRLFIYQLSARGN